MILYTDGHPFHYEMENLCRVFFPEEQIKTVAADEPGEPHVTTALRETLGGSKVSCEVFLEGERFCAEELIPAQQAQEEGECERRMAVVLFDVLSRATGYRPQWGILTGVRPSKLMNRLTGQYGAAGAQAYFQNRLLVSPEKTALAFDVAQAEKRIMDTSRPESFSLYLSIPFCPTRCSYCSFVSHSITASKAQKLLPRYVELLCEELAITGRIASELGLRLETVYYGGGTPTTLAAEDLMRLHAAVEENFDLSTMREYTVEAGRPDTITAEKLVVLRTHGVTRVSVNPQTFEENVLRAIGRCHTAADIDRAMELVARCGFPHVNMDLIAGLPEDTAEGFRRSLDRCLTYGPDAITVHTLALKKGSRVLTEGLRIPGAETVAEMLDYASPTLRTAGYRPYYLYRQKYMSGSFENIGWCRSGGECWYNVDIMSELCSILSFGAAGSTKMVVPGTNQIQRAFNVKYPTEYIQRPEKWQANQTAFAAFYEAL